MVLSIIKLFSFNNDLFLNIHKLCFSGNDNRINYNFNNSDRTFGPTGNKSHIASPTISLHGNSQHTTSTVVNTSNAITLQNTVPQFGNINTIQQLQRGWEQGQTTPTTASSQAHVTHLKQEQIDPSRLQDEQSLGCKSTQPSDNSEVGLALGSAQMGNNLASSNQMRKKKSDSKILEDYEKQQIVEEMANNKLGEMCPVCYKIFRNKDALEFHIMNTKMMGHEDLVKQRMKNSSSTSGSSMLQPSLEVMTTSLDVQNIDINTGMLSTKEHKFQNNAIKNGTMDSKTGMFKAVKQEPLTDHEPTTMLHTPRVAEPEIREEDIDTLSTTEQIKLPPTSKSVMHGNQVQQIKNQAKTSTAANENLNFAGGSVKTVTAPMLMPPPSSTSLIRKPKKTSVSKIFKCFECNRAFKNEMKLIKHVMRKHSKKKNSNKTPAQEPESNFKLADGGKSQNQHQTKNDVQQLIPSEIPSESENTYQKQNGDDKSNVNQASLKFSPMGCPDCVMLFATKDDMMVHFSRSPHRLMCNLNVNKCPVLTCDVSFATKSKLLEHLVAGKHGQPCPQCGKDFPKVGQ